MLGFRHKERAARTRGARSSALLPGKALRASPTSPCLSRVPGSIPNPARQGFARKQRGDLSPRDGLRAASEASDPLFGIPGSYA